MLAHYLDMLGKAGMIEALPKYGDKELVQRRSSLRLMVYDTALMTALSDKGKDRLLGEADLRGHLVESAAGAFLLARAPVEGFDVYWWRENNDGVDFVLRRGRC